MRVDRFELVSELARGAMGVVFRAFDTELRREVALKLLPADAWLTEDLLRFQHEAQAMARVKHKNLVAVHSTGTTGGRPYIVMDLVQGESLAARLERGQRPEPRAAARLILSLAQGLAVAHREGVIHRDVKPANVMLDARGEPVLIDFGLARDVNRRTRFTQEGDLLGTPAYMAPEQAAGRNQLVGPATDVYALGATLHHLLGGSPPFTGRGMLDTVELIQHAPPPPLSGLDPGLQAILHRCLEKEPARRFPDAGALAAALEGWLDGESPAAPPVARRVRPGAAPLLAGAALLALVAGVALAARGGPEPVATAPAPPAPSDPAPPDPAPPPPPVRAPSPAPPPPPRPTGPNPTDTELWAAYEARDFATMERLARRRLGHVPDDPGGLIGLGRALLELRRRDESLPVLRRLVEVDPGCAAGWELLVRLARESGDLPAAEAASERCLATGPTSDRVRVGVELRVLVGDLERARADLDAGRRQMEEAEARRLDDVLQRLEPALTEGHDVLARADEQLSRPAPARSGGRALEELVHALEHAGDTLDALGEGRLQEALGQAIVELDPDRDDGYEVRGRARLRLGRPTDALRDAQRMIDIEPEDPDGWVYHARAQEQLGRREEALRDLERALERARAQGGHKEIAVQAELRGLRKR